MGRSTGIAAAAETARRLLPSTRDVYVGTGGVVGVG